jgi:ADP-heptose:LPS heptosyltransferase
LLKIDCSHFPGDRPCYFHKNYGLECDNCSNYQPIGFRILIIKLDALGDVLRTTTILPPLKEKYPNSYITWYTKFNANQIFDNNNFVNEVLNLENDAMYRLETEEYDLVINLDNSKISAAIASQVRGKEKIGFLLNKKGYIEPTSELANH